MIEHETQEHLSSDSIEEPGYSEEWSNFLEEPDHRGRVIDGTCQAKDEK